MSAEARVTPAGSIAANLADVRRRVEAACARAGRDPASVTIIGVTKTVPAPLILEAIAAGLTDIGENYVQEAAAKRASLGDQAARVRWHLIGGLQSNKVNAALGLFDMVQAIDAVRRAEAVSRRSQRPYPVLLEVNIAAETTKAGFAPQDIPAAIKTIAALPNIDLRGLMTVAPFRADPEEARPVFRALRALAEAHGLTELSMGMTSDFEVAVEEGATMVRIGRAIFGERST